MEMSVELAERLSSALGVRAGYLLFGEGAPSEDADEARRVGAVEALLKVARLAREMADELIPGLGIPAHPEEATYRVAHAPSVHPPAKGQARRKRSG